MIDVFLSYAREDSRSARLIATRLVEQGWAVFSDRTIPPGKTWREVIGTHLDQCRCLVVVWSSSSIKSAWVIEEADHARQTGKLVPVRIEDVTPPLGLRSVQAADLLDWRGDQDDPGFQALCAAVREHAPLAASTQQSDEPATPRAADERSEAHAPVSRWKRPAWMTRRRFIVGGIVASVVTSAAAFFAFADRWRRRVFRWIRRSTPEVVVNAKNGVIHDPVICAAHLPASAGRRERILDGDRFHNQYEPAIVARMAQQLDAEDAIGLILPALARHPAAIHLYDLAIDLLGKLKRYSEMDRILAVGIDAVSSRLVTTVPDTADYRSLIRAGSTLEARRQTAQLRALRRN